MSFFDVFRKKNWFTFDPTKEYILGCDRKVGNEEKIGAFLADNKYNCQSNNKVDVIQPKPKPEEKPLGKFCFDSPFISSDRLEEKRPWIPPKNHFVYRKPMLSKKTVIAICVENSIMTQAYRSKIYNLISKVIEDNKDALFLLTRMDNQNEYFELAEYFDLKHQDLQKSLFPLGSCSTRYINLSDALAHVCDYATLPNSKLENAITFKYRRFEVDNYKIIFIGTGITDSTSQEMQLSSEFLKLLCASNNVKAIKYFCTKDEYTINASSIGFPVIGHIESNFYE